MSNSIKVTAKQKLDLFKCEEVTCLSSMAEKIQARTTVDAKINELLGKLQGGQMPMPKWLAPLTANTENMRQAVRAILSQYNVWTMHDLTLMRLMVLSDEYYKLDAHIKLSQKHNIEGGLS